MKLFITVILFITLSLSSYGQSIGTFQCDTSGNMTFSMVYTGDRINYTIRMQREGSWEQIGGGGVVHLIPVRLSEGPFTYEDSVSIPLFPGTNRFRLVPENGPFQEITVQSSTQKNIEDYSKIPYILFKENVHYFVLDPSGAIVLCDSGKIIKFDSLRPGRYYLNLREGATTKIIAFTR